MPDVVGRRFHSRPDAAKPSGADTLVWVCVSDLPFGAGRMRRRRRHCTLFSLERTRLGAMIRAGVDDGQMACAVGIPVSKLFTVVFCLGTGIAGAGGVLGGPILSAYPGLDATCFR